MKQEYIKHPRHRLEDKIVKEGVLKAKFQMEQTQYIEERLKKIDFKIDTNMDLGFLLNVPTRHNFTICFQLPLPEEPVLKALMKVKPKFLEYLRDELGNYRQD